MAEDKAATIEQGDDGVPGDSQSNVMVGVHGNRKRRVQTPGGAKKTRMHGNNLGGVDNYASDKIIPMHGDNSRGEAIASAVILGDNNGTGGGSTVAGAHKKGQCASCKNTKKKCDETCKLAPYFPVDKEEDYLLVHKIFGRNNIIKSVINLESQDDATTAIDSLIWEAQCWKDDPIGGPYREYKRLLQDNQRFKEENKQLLLRSFNVQTIPNHYMTHGSVINHNSVGSPNMIDSGVNRVYNNSMNHNGHDSSVNYALNNISGIDIDNDRFLDALSNQSLNFCAQPYNYNIPPTQQQQQPTAVQDADHSLNNVTNSTRSCHDIYSHLIFP
ncbi:Lob domain-containing protein, partial [Thalictrum thalictroides]